MVSSDCYLTIGANHAICEDYALSAGNHVVLSDGCSGANHTDVGARLLCHAALANQGLWVGGIPSDLVSVVRTLGLSRSSLMATLLSVEYDEDRHVFVVRVVGDGYVGAKRRDGSLVVHEVSYDVGAPLYGAYLLDSGYMDSYRKEYGNPVRRITVFEPDDVPVATLDVVQDLVHKIEFSASEFATVAVFSDGVGSFTRKSLSNQVTRVSAIEIISQMMAYKNYQGEFVTRRMVSFFKSSARLKDVVESHSDDVSCAAIHVTDEEVP